MFFFWRNNYRTNDYGTWYTYSWLELKLIITMISICIDRQVVGEKKSDFISSE